MVQMKGAVMAKSKLRPQLAAAVFRRNGVELLVDAAPRPRTPAPSCAEFCPGGHACCLSANAPHTMHICPRPDCACHHYRH